MRSLVLTLCFLVVFGATFGQKACIHDDLSRTLRITSSVQRKPGDSIISNDCPITVTIIDKASKKIIQVISFTAVSLYDRSFTKCSWVRSYSTGKNRNAEVVETDFGDIVVADFNFDSKEDIAIKADEELGGDYYRFYLQGKDGLFTLDPFLTDTMSIAPTYYNKTKKTLTTFAVSGVRDAEDVYRLDIRTNRWKRIRHRLF